MKNFKTVRKVLSIVLALTVVFTMVNGSVFTVSADRLSDLEDNRDKTKASLEEITAQVNAQKEKVIESKNKLSEINNLITENETIISESEEKIEKDKAEFQRRIRSIYMSNSESRIKILLGAESFSQFLQLAQLTSSVSAYDKQIIEELAETIKVQEEKKKENETKKAEQEKVQAELDKQLEELSAKQNEAQEAFDAAEHDVEAEKERQRQEEEAQRRRAQSGSSGSASAPAFVGSGVFCWPSVYSYVIAGYNSGDSVHNGVHHGIDIAGGGIYGTPIYAIGDGYVTYVANYCPHDFGKYYGCGCGGNYGRYAQIDHGTVNGNHYSAIYAHASNIIVSPGQYVSKGQVIGYVGTTGWSTGPHLHLGIYQNGSYIDPMYIF